VTIVHRRDELRASKIMATRAISNPKIQFASNSAVEAIHGQDKVTGVTLRDTVTGAMRPLQVTGDSATQFIGGSKLGQQQN